jgi:hypothetical protein
MAGVIMKVIKYLYRIEPERRFYNTGVLKGGLFFKDVEHAKEDVPKIKAYLEEHYPLEEGQTIELHTVTRFSVWRDEFWVCECVEIGEASE